MKTNEPSSECKDEIAIKSQVDIDLIFFLVDAVGNDQSRVRQQLGRIATRCQNPIYRQEIQRQDEGGHINEWSAKLGLPSPLESTQQRT